MLLGYVDRAIGFSGLVVVAIDLVFAGLTGIEVNPFSKGSNWMDLNARRHLR